VTPTTIQIIDGSALVIDPIIFTFKIGNITLAIHWYGLLISIGIFVAAWLTEKEMARRGGNPYVVWEVLLWAVIAGVIGARLWYVAGDILGGNTRFLENPLTIINTTLGGLHIYGGLLFGGLVVLFYTHRKKIDMRLMMDAVAPGLLIGQAIGRIGNFINQELYGPPTDLPWGIPIQAQYRIPPFNDLSQYPEETTRFHPTFAYEMLWNFLAAGILLWASRRFGKRLKPGTIFAGWLILAGFGRVVIESFRPDQPTFPGTSLSYSRLVAALMGISGVLVLLVKYEKIQLPFLSPGPDTYQIPEPASEGQPE
jgi:phosphatidylglycerol:prolipoprotein diacylglycerol transferase